MSHHLFFYYFFFFFGASKTRWTENLEVFLQVLTQSLINLFFFPEGPDGSTV